MIVDVSLTKVQTNVGIDGVIVVKENNTPSALKILTSLPFGGNRVIAMTSTGIDYADFLNANETLGFTKYAASANTLATILFNGDLNGFTGLIVGQLIYLSTNGTITQTPPTSGNLQILGVAISDTKISINIQQPIFLG